MVLGMSSWYACVDMTFLIVKGPPFRLSNFLEGLVVLRFDNNSHTLSPSLNPSIDFSIPWCSLIDALISSQMVSIWDLISSAAGTLSLSPIWWLSDDHLRFLPYTASKALHPVDGFL